mgnify:CR=1 FL=1
MREKSVVDQHLESEYQHGFVTHVAQDVLSKGLDESVVRWISKEKNEPEFLLKYRLDAFEYWKSLQPPNWAKLKINKIDFQAISYYAAPKGKPTYNSLSEVDPELLRTYERLGIPLHEQKKVSRCSSGCCI